MPCEPVEEQRGRDSSPTAGGRPYYADDWLTVYNGDCREAMAAMEPESVHCVVTSPPYWGLRDYGTPGQLGLEPTPEQYVENMVSVFREVRRVLRADGTVWLNLGDSYANTGKSGGGDQGERWAKNGGAVTAEREGEWKNFRPAPLGLKPKDLVGIPWRVAFALQADGWYLRSDIIWSKPNPMPESVTDRPTKAHEYLFLLSKSPRYYYDADAVREDGTGRTAGNRGPVKGAGNDDPYFRTREGFEKVADKPWTARNLRSVWSIGYNDVEWTSAIGSCRRCGGLRVAGLGPEPTTSKATGVSRLPVNGRDHANSAPIGSPTNSLWDRSPQDSPSTTSVGTEDASDPTISSQSPSGSTSIEATPRPRVTLPRPAASTGTSSPPRTLTDALTASGNAVCVCEIVNDGDEPLSDVWEIATQPYPGAHFATFPEKLVEPCIKAGSPALGTVLDPFAGSGTTGRVAQRLGRRAVLIDLSGEYLTQAMTRNADIPLGLESA